MVVDKTTIGLTGIDNVLDMLRTLPAEVVGKRGGPVKTWLRKGAKYLQGKLLTRLELVTSNATTHPERDNTQTLKRSSIVSRGKPPTDGRGERYLVRWKRLTYDRVGKPVTTHKTAQLLEYGGADQPAEPFIRPTVQTEGEATIRLITGGLAADVDRIAQRLLKG